jgi:hypothetical protein
MDSEESKVSKGIQMLREQGHLVEARVLFDKLCWEIDCQLLATREELEHLADGVYSFDELEELHLKRLAEEQAAE